MQSGKKEVLWETREEAVLTSPTQALLCYVARDTKGAGELWGKNLSRIGEDIKAHSPMLVKLARVKFKTGAF